MFPQTELDNYKLQVELLQEKLKRSEEQRKQLEEKFDCVLKRRSEQEKISKAKSILQRQKFLEEQKERNERNKALLRLLEQINQQAAALATRSERLKMMKLQYEIYFAKLLQAYSLRSTQNSPGRIGIVPAMPANLIQTNVSPSFASEDISQQHQHQQGQHQQEPNLNVLRGPTLVAPDNNYWIPMQPAMMTPNFSVGSPYQMHPHQMGYFQTAPMVITAPNPNDGFLSSRYHNFKSSPTMMEDTLSPGYPYPSPQINSLFNTKRPQMREFERFKSNDQLSVPTVISNTDSRGGGMNEYSEKDQYHQYHHRPQEIINNNNKISGESQIIDDDYYEEDDDSSKSTDDRGRRPYEGKFKSRKYENQRRKSESIQLEDYSPGQQQTDSKDIEREESVDERKPTHAQKDLKLNEDFQNKPLQEEIKRDHERNYSNFEQPKEELSFGEKLMRDANRANQDKIRTPITWNFGSRTEERAKSPIPLGKKEKLSVENIENAIYGEVLSPVRRNGMDNYRTSAYPKQTFSSIGTIRIGNPHKISEEKLDISEKDMSPKSPTLSSVNGKFGSPLKSPDSTLLQHNVNQDRASSQPQYQEQDVVSSPQLIQDHQQENLNKGNYEPFPSSPQTYSSELSNVDKLPQQSNKDQKGPMSPQAQQSGEQQKKEPQLYGTYSPEEENLNQVPLEDTSQQQSEQQIEPNYSEQETYQKEQWQNQDYQYPQDYNQQDQNYQEYPNTNLQQGDYNQGNEYMEPQDYSQSGDFQQQGDYAQQDYDPNAYQYNYDQQNPDGTAYQDPNQQIQYSTGEYDGQEYQQTYGGEYAAGNEYQNQNYENLPQGESTPQPEQYDQYPSTTSYNQEGSQLETIATKEQNLLPQPDEVKDNIPNTNPQPDVGNPKGNSTAATNKPTSILSTDKPTDGNKKKKKVNFLDSESEESSSTSKPDQTNKSPTSAHDESDFEFSSSSK